MNQLTTFGDSVLVSVTTGFQRFFGFLPALLGAIIVIAIGWFLSKLVARLVDRGLHAIGFERLAMRAGISDFVARTETHMTASSIMGTLAHWFIFLIFVQAGATVLGIPQVTQIINNIILFIPRLVVAGLILLIGAFLANFVGKLVRGSASEMGLSNPNFLSNFTRYAVTGFFIIAALSQLGIAPVIVNSLFIALIAGVSLAFGLAFGLGGREVAHQITRNIYDRSKVGIGAEGTPPRTLRSASGQVNPNVPPKTGTEY